MLQFFSLISDSLGSVCWAWLGGNLCAIFIEARLVARLVARFISVVHKAHTNEVAKLVRKVNIENNQ